jgi:hypothetical protein
MTSEECDHYSYECNYGSHTCADCKEYLGTQLNMVIPHNAIDCGVCGPQVEHEGVPCTLPHPCEYKTYSTRVSRKPDKFVTKDSGVREEYDSGMVRDIQDGKPRYDLLFVDGLPMEEQLLTRWAQLLERGARKYGEKNWQLANSEDEQARFRASAARHFFQWMMGEEDEDHAAAVCYNLSSYIYLDWKLRQNPDSTEM